LGKKFTECIFFLAEVAEIAEFCLILHTVITEITENNNEEANDKQVYGEMFFAVLSFYSFILVLMGAGREECYATLRPWLEEP
jgi:hypothetical protein